MQFKKIINLKNYFIMSKLSLNALKERAEAVASIELLNSISGGTENSCHPCNHSNADTSSAPGDPHWTSNTLKAANAWAHWLFCL